ncbi:PRC-barrel domain containing protein [Dyadobacter alkalitolerans]|uniref:PRC-barrel domain containing protein n=1 Tax=Dyadobacter alkalitolerans TaxID=492736 RepID=UPI000413C26C|nr:PRC-barrel domain-containing protein [Dyadobacter alkalitolerans]
MKISVKGITGFSIGAIDGEMGVVKEIYFEDHTWTVRYLIVKTGNFLKDKLILVSTQALLAPDWDNELFPTNLSMDQIINSPDIDTDKPVYRQQEIKLYEHFPWDIYWAMGIIPMEDSVEIAISEKEKEISAKANPHLRSSEKVTGYSLHATDGELGHIDDLIIETDSWKITSVVVKTGNWFSGKEILMPTEWILEIDWLSSTFAVDATVEQVQQCEPFDAGDAVNEAYEKVLRDYKGRRI